METSSEEADLDTAVSQALSLAVSQDPEAISFEALTASGLLPPRLLAFIEDSVGQASRQGGDLNVVGSSLLQSLRIALQKTLSEVGSDSK